MPVSPAYVSKEAVTNLWRNRLMTAAAILTVAVSLALVGSALLLKQGASKATELWQNGVQTIVWVDPSAGAAQTAAIRAQLHQSPYVKTCNYRSQSYDYSEAKRVLPADEVAATTQANYPASFRCQLTNPSQAPALYLAFYGKPGVFDVKYPGQQIKTMQSVIRVLQWVFLTVAVVLLLSASVLILNTIRMAIFARRREVSVMKLVGATNWFIRVPFMSEGLIQGLLGSGLAALAVYVLYLVINHYGSGNSSNVLTAMHMTGGEVVLTNAVVVLVGVIIGSLGSAIAIRRFLDV
ncbi:MAG: cell division protein FtsX [Acidimicrobiales bacterium]